MATTTRRPAPPQLPPEPPGPRPMPAGMALFVMIGGLLMGLLLNAGDIWETAARQPAGWQRSLALSIAEPAWDVAHALRLDLPRRTIDRALGRDPGGPGTEETSSPTTQPPSTTAPTTPPPDPTTTTVPERREVSAAHPLRLYVGGDSMVGQFGPMLANRAQRSGLVESEVVFEFESGLTRPDFVDWPARLEEHLGRFDPDVVVLFFGGNDAQAIQIDGVWHDYGTEEWLREYRERVGAVMDQVTADGTDLYWMGMPIVRSESFREKVTVMNEIYRSEAEARLDVRFVDTWSEFLGPDGGYAEYLPDADGAVVDMRLDDGVHFTTAGGIKLAEVVFTLIDEEWELEEGG